VKPPQLMDLLGAFSWRRRFAPDDPNLAHLEKAADGSKAEELGLSIGGTPKWMVHDGKTHGFKPLKNPLKWMIWRSTDGQELRVLEAMTPVALASNHKSVPW
jgi:hypothetical protein